MACARWSVPWLSSSTASLPVRPEVSKGRPRRQTHSFAPSLSKRPHRGRLAGSKREREREAALRQAQGERMGFVRGPFDTSGRTGWVWPQGLSIAKRPCPGVSKGQGERGLTVRPRIRPASNVHHRHRPHVQVSLQRLRPALRPVARVLQTAERHLRRREDLLQQIDLGALERNLKRIRQGLPPLNPAFCSPDHCIGRRISSSGLRPCIPISSP